MTACLDTQMPAMILAAGYGKRLHPLTQKIPKPLIKAGNECLIEHQIRALQKAGFTKLVINLSYKANQIRTYLQDGNRYGVQIEYSFEKPAPFGSAKGVIKALPLLNSDRFIVTNSDIWTDFDYSRLSIKDNFHAHLVLVDGQMHGLKHDFYLSDQGLVLCSSEKGAKPLTFAGIGCYRRELFEHCDPETPELSSLLKEAINKELVSAEHFTGRWIDAGSHENLERLRSWL